MADEHEMSGRKIPVGISMCLLGQNVRFDGGHKHDPLITEVLSQYFSWVPVCPEVEIGLGVPREPLNLVSSEDGVRLVASKSGQNLTEQMRAYAQARLEELAKMGLRGYILKKDSPSCGIARVRVYDQSNMPKYDGVGLFAQALLARFPHLPSEEEDRLHDARLLENFITRVFAYDRWQSLREQEPPSPKE